MYRFSGWQMVSYRYIQQLAYQKRVGKVEMCGTFPSTDKSVFYDTDSSNYSDTVTNDGFNR